MWGSGLTAARSREPKLNSGVVAEIVATADGASTFWAELVPCQQMLRATILAAFALVSTSL